MHRSILVHLKIALSATKGGNLVGVNKLTVLTGLSRYQHIGHSPDLDLPSPFFRLRQVIGCLHP
jgi:hypothetical protein